MHPELLRGSSDSLDLGSFAASGGYARVAERVVPHRFREKGVHERCSTESQKGNVGAAGVSRRRGLATAVVATRSPAERVPRREGRSIAPWQARVRRVQARKAQACKASRRAARVRHGEDVRGGEARAHAARHGKNTARAGGVRHAHAYVHAHGAEASAVSRRKNVGGELVAYGLLARAAVHGSVVGLGSCTKRARGEAQTEDDAKALT
jgi:hypothetical protein